MTEGHFQTLRVTRGRGRMDIRLDRPKVRNAFDDRLILELTEALARASEDRDLRCLVLDGEGPVFSAGADLNYMRKAAEHGQEANLEDARKLANLFRTLQSVPFPTLASVRGAALGGAGGLVACVDIAIAAIDTKFGFTEVRLGIIPAVISSFVLRKISRSAALRYFQTGELFDGRRAVDLGLVAEAVPSEDVESTTEGLVSELMKSAPLATREAKRLVNEVSTARSEDVLEMTARWIATLREGPEAQEGMAAFLDKRHPSWRGDVP